MDRNGNWQRHHDAAREHGCWCANERKPCGYHEGYVDGYDTARASRPLNSREPVRKSAVPVIGPMQETN